MSLGARATGGRIAAAFRRSLFKEIFPVVQFFRSGDLSIAYVDEGGSEVDGDPILLIHGFASNHRVNWLSTGWFSTLLDAGRRVIALDNRGHGESDKPHDAASYGTPVMADDAARLLDHLEIANADVMGYSMGARITAFMGLQHPDRVRSCILSGLGSGLVKGVGAPGPIAEALLAPSLADVETDTGRMFRAFADQTGADRQALAACITASRQTLSPDELAKLDLPVLVAVGTEDDIGGSADELAKLIPGAQAFAIEGRDHMKAVGDRSHKAAVVEFLGRRP
jgi:pimeloyl-ACP methyl ester carboxylesterase